MSSSVDDNSNHHEQDDLSTDINQIVQERVIVQFNPLGEAVGPNATRFKSEIGNLVRTFVPIRYISWLKVPAIHKDDVWNGLVAKFDIPADVRKQIEKSMSEVFRKRKSTLRKDFLDKHPTLEAKILAIPPKITQQDWEQFCINESSDKQIEMRAKGVESRKRKMYGHTGGRKSAAMVEYEMVEKRKGDPVSGTEVWIETHTSNPTSKDGSIPPNVKPFMDEVEDKLRESKKNKGSGVHLLSIEDDPLTQVFGKKAKGLPNVGSSISKSKYDDTLRSPIMYSEEESKSKSKSKSLKSKIGKMGTQLDLVYGHYKTTDSLRQSDEPASAKVDDGNSSETVILFDPEVLVCPICFGNLFIPVYQCSNGHLLCSHCSVRVKDFCPTCNSQSEHYRCRGIEKILESAKSACPNKKHGCEMITPWIDKLAHESACLFTSCCCPVSNCTFIGTASQLSYHVPRDHNNIVLFTHGKTFHAKLSRDMEFRILVEKEMEINVFVLHNQRRVDGNAFSISATVFKKYLYKLEVKHGERTQSIKAPTEIVQRVKADYAPTHDLVVPDSYFNSLGEIELKIKVYTSEKHD